MTEEQIMASGLHANFEALEKMRAEGKFNDPEYDLRLALVPKLITQKIGKRDSLKRAEVVNTITGARSR